MAQQLPAILGALLDGVSSVLARRDDAANRLKGKLPRLADFAVCAEAAGAAFGWQDGEFHAAYQKSIAARLGTAAESDRFVQLVAEWLPNFNSGRFEGGAADLLEALRTYVRSTPQEAVLEEKWFPKSSVWLGRTLPGRRRLLRAAGVEYMRVENPGTNSAQHKLVALALHSQLPLEEW